ncbi:hypothetical protein SAMN05660297_00290 [Natronincola peptidivorans]|uniref:UbiA prenyltransferase family protein n=1 Tax=Natronincola peptidivorans TaxID=426128 RepID=A0A1H9YLA9_9FIRM|nr:hypothetical protein [Natronincola peptidivorans]SES69825.1 hypothetical protein SAMN05660297_00290 [Natronincola peptidivorans]
MYLELFNKYIGLLLLGVVIKLLDDEVDEDTKDKIAESKIYANLSQYKLPYSLLFLSLAMLLQPHLVFSIFTSAYIIGMFYFPHQILPLKLKAYQEMIILILLNIIFIPPNIFAIAFLSILLIQFIDDLLDYQYDFKYGYKNYVNNLGLGEIVIASSILLIICFIISWTNTITILTSSFLVNYLYDKI